MPLEVKASTNKSNKHSTNVSSVLSHNDLIISGSDDGKIKIWNSRLDLVSEFQVPGAILSLTACENTLYSCSADETIRSWNLNTSKPIGQISTSLFRPQKLYMEKESKTLWAGDSQGNVAKYEANGEEIGKYELVEEVWDIMVTNNPNLIYTARDRDIVISELTVGTRSTRAFVKCTLSGRSPFCLAGHRLCFLDREGRSILVHDNVLNKKFPRLSEIPASEFIINAMAAVGDNVIYTGGYDSTVKKWDLNNSTCLGSVNMNSCVNAIAALSDNEVFVATSDGSITQIGN